MHSGEIPNDRRQQIGCNRWDHADVQLARKPAPRRSREVSQFIDRAQDVADAQSGLFSELRKPAPCARSSDMALTRHRIEIAKLRERYLVQQNIVSQHSR